MNNPGEAFEAILGLLVGGAILTVFASETSQLTGGGLEIVGIAAIVGGVFLGVVLAVAGVMSIVSGVI